MENYLNVKYEGNPCYNIYFRPDFSELSTVVKSDLNKEYDNICIVSDSNVSGLYLGQVVSIFKELIVSWGAEYERKIEEECASLPSFLATQHHLLAIILED